MLNKQISAPFWLFITILLFENVNFYAQVPVYSNVAEAQGIQHTYLLNNSGGGVSFMDFDLDGLDDITLASGQEELIQFYRNTGSNFEKLSLNINNKEEAKSVLWVDIDNDGDKDFYVSAFIGVNRLYENLGDLTFSDITNSAGLPSDTMKSFGAIWGDYNRDGYLDLYYTERPNADSGTLQRNRLFKNLGNNTFEETTYTSGASDEGRLPFCAAFFDYNNDKWPDIYIANDRKKRNTLLKNNQGNFEDITELCGAGIEMDAMNVSIADIDNDGLSDIYITNTPDGSALLKCDKDEDEYMYNNEANERGVGFYGIGWGANFLDANNDGWKDLYVSGMLIGSESISSAFYLNDQTGFFTHIEQGFEGDTVRSFVNAVGDFNDDGYPDIMVNNSEYFKSQLWTANPGDNSWLKINLRGIKSNRDGIGSKIEIFSGGSYQFVFTQCGSGFMGQNSSTELFGLGQNSLVDSIIVTWPTGHIDKLKNLTVNQKIEIEEGSTSAGVIHLDEDIKLLTSTQINIPNNDLILYPNPTSKSVRLLVQDNFQKYYIRDLAGNRLLSGISNEIDLQDLIPGVYLVEITFKDGTRQFTKIVKQ